MKRELLVSVVPGQPIPERAYGVRERAGNLPWLVTVPVLAWLLAGVGGWAQGLSLDPSHEEMMRFLLAVCPTSPCLEMGVAGHSVEGRPIPYVVVRQPGLPQEKAIRLLVVARLHGDEPAGTAALLHLLDAVRQARSGYPVNLLQGVAWMVLPMANPDGALTNHHRNRAGVDLGEDWDDLTQPETRAVRDMIESWHPHLVLDLHEHAERGPRMELARPADTEPSLQEYAGSVRLFLIQRLRGYHYGVREEQEPTFPESRLPSFVQARYRVPALLVESRRKGVPLNLRAGVHVISVLGAAEYLSRAEPPAVEWPEPLTPPSVPAWAPPSPPPPVSPLPAAGPLPRRPQSRSSSSAAERPIRLQVIEPADGAVVQGTFEVRVALESPVPIGSVLLTVDGKLRAMGNNLPFRCRLDASQWEPGVHRLTVSVKGGTGKLLAEMERLIRVPARSE